MNRQNNDKWLDELISKTINSEKPQFDAVKWKQKFPDEFKALQSRASKPTVHKIYWRGILESPMARLAAASVVIILAFGLIMFHLQPDDKVDIPQIPHVTQSPAEMLTLRSLKIAYYTGGIEAVEAQCDNAIEQLKLKSNKITVNELLADINGT